MSLQRPDLGWAGWIESPSQLSEPRPVRYGQSENSARRATPVPSELEIIEADLDGKVARGLLARYYDELAARFPGGFETC